jgi:hypothetical protein
MIALLFFIINTNNHNLCLQQVYSLLLWKLKTVVLWEAFEDTNEVIRIRKSKDRQHNFQKKQDRKDKQRSICFEDYLGVGGMLVESNQIYVVCSLPFLFLFNFF